MADEASKSTERHGRRSRRDLRPPAMRVPSVEDWRDPFSTLEALRSWAESQAAEAIDWYLRDKALKRIGSRLLRALAILFAIAGGVAPLLAATGDRSTSWGYVALALAAGCVAFDHFFGLSSGWMRDISAAQALRRRLSTFRFAWTTANANAALGAGAAADAAARISLIEEFAVDVADLVDAETGEWLAEFRANITSFATQDQRSLPAVSPRTERS
ncbi:MAG TPA: SLATT domain-containing protein [Actinoplanes sp.]|jgi:hypothetical protein|nr:SLATT domain-containing protein [Actinoplanes sp.]